MKEQSKRKMRRVRRKRSHNSKNYFLPLLTLLIGSFVILYVIVAVRTFSSLPNSATKAESPKKNRLIPIFSKHDTPQLWQKEFPIDIHEEEDDDDDDDDNNNNDDTGSIISGDNLKKLNIQIKKDFPIKVEHNSDEYESIFHPGDAMLPTPKYNKIQVPKLWEPEGGRASLGEALMTPAQAASVGSKIELEENGTQLETIFVSVASYRDYQCTSTVEDIFIRAKYPQRIRVAVIDQIAKEVNDKVCLPTKQDCELAPDQILCQYSQLIDVYEMDASLAVGPVFARHLGHRMYRGEYFAMQVDAHVSFVQDWDEDVVQQWKSAQNEMAILTVYLSDVQGSIDPDTHKSLHPDRPIMCQSDFTTGLFLQHGQQPEGPAGIHGEPTLEPYWAAGFSFARGHFIVNVPYDQHLPMIFQGEEISMGLRAFTYGYDFYTPERAVCFHMYAIRENKEKRSNVKLFWENSSRYMGVGHASFLRLRQIIGMIRDSEKEKEWYKKDAEKYGLGKVRTPQKFYQTYGIHMNERKIEHHLCKFAGKRMHSLFISALRSDGMGLDYDKISYEFKDPDAPEQT